MAIARRTIRIRHAGERGQRVVFDANQDHHLLNPGDEIDIEVAEPQAAWMEQASRTGGSDLRIVGFDPAVPTPAPPQPDRAALAEAERAAMEEGQRVERDQREKEAKKASDVEIENIRMHAKKT